MIRTVKATRYVTPLREGGSLPAIVEADDLGLYVLKFRGAGQGPLVLVAELLAGEIGRALGLPVPEIVLVDVDPALGRNEPDQEIQDLLRASVGLNLALDYLPGSVMFDPAAGDTAEPAQASMAVWFDSFITNVDRTASNPNLLCWHRTLYFIDHGASLYFQHNWESRLESAASPFTQIRKHVLLKWAERIPQAAEAALSRLSSRLFSDLVGLIPDAWLLSPEFGEGSAESGMNPIHPDQRRDGYVQFFEQRLQNSSKFVEEAVRARSVFL